MSRIRLIPHVGWLVVLCVGCAEPTPLPSGSQPPATTPAAPTAAETAPAPSAAATAAGPATPPSAAGSAAAPVPAVATPPTPSAGATPATELVPAEAGVGQKGRSLDKYQEGVQRVIAEPAKALFATKERLVFSVQVPQALQLFKAEKGYAPRSHDEFMREIVQFNNIVLPELPPGQRYVYDPQREELMVERPAR